LARSVGFLCMLKLKFNLGREECYLYLSKKERQLESLIYNYLKTCGIIQSHFVKAMNTYLKEGISEDFQFLIEQTHKVEPRADAAQYFDRMVSDSDDCLFYRGCTLFCRESAIYTGTLNQWP